MRKCAAALKVALPLLLLLAVTAPVLGTLLHAVPSRQALPGPVHPLDVRHPLVSRTAAVR